VSGLSPFLQVIWIASVALQVASLALVVLRRHYRTLPSFTWYIGLNFAQAIILVAAYSHWGFTSTTAFRMFWTTEAITMIAQTLASIEILHRALEDYPGIWALTWRLITFAVIAVVVYAGATADRNDQWGLMAVDRGYNLTFAVATVACLLLVRHYSISIDRVYKAMLGGFCLYSCGVFVSDTLMQKLFLEHFPKYSEVWNESELLIFLATEFVWIFALVHPVRGKAKTPSASSATAYEEFAPQVNARLRELNDTLRKFFRKQATQP
jgi:hypothetical protein